MSEMVVTVAVMFSCEGLRGHIIDDVALLRG